MFYLLQDGCISTQVPQSLDPALLPRSRALLFVGAQQTIYTHGILDYGSKAQHEGDTRNHGL